MEKPIDKRGKLNEAHVANRYHALHDLFADVHGDAIAAWKAEKDR